MGIPPSSSRSTCCLNCLVYWRLLRPMEERFSLLAEEPFTLARTVVFDSIEVWYNRKRRHSTLGYLSPDAFERQYQQLLRRSPQLRTPSLEAKPTLMT